MAQRTRSHTEILREKTAKTRQVNLSELVERYIEMKEDKDKTKMDESWEVLPHKAVDSLSLPTKAELKDMKYICKTMEKLISLSKISQSWKKSINQRKGSVGLTKKLKPRMKEKKNQMI